MKKLLLSSALLLCCTTGFAQDKAVKADIYGFVRNYFTYDSRSCVQSNEGLFNMLPNDHKYGVDGEDLNAIPSVRFLSITTRFGVNVSGPEIWGAKSSAKFESDFCGASSSSAFNLRIRQAYAKLAWEKVRIYMDFFMKHGVKVQARLQCRGEVVDELAGLTQGVKIEIKD
jgi:hypothetical protein